MTLSMILRTVFEILMLVAVVWGIFNESKLAAAEKRFFCALKRRRLRIAKPAAKNHTDCRRSTMRTENTGHSSELRQAAVSGKGFILY